MRHELLLRWADSGDNRFRVALAPELRRAVHRARGGLGVPLADHVVILAGDVALVPGDLPLRVPWLAPQGRLPAFSTCSDSAHL